MPRRVRLHQDVTIVDVSHRRAELAVEVATSTGGRGRISFEHDDQGAMSDHLTALRRWMHLGTPLTYVWSDGSGALIDDRARFEHAFGEAGYL